MRRSRSLRALLAGLFVFALLPAAGAGGGVAITPSPDLDRLLVDGLGFDPAQVSRWNEGLVDVGDQWAAFGWGGDASVSATIGAEDAPWTVPDSIGVNFVQWQDSGRLPVFAPGIDFGPGIGPDGMWVSGAVGGGPSLGTTFAVMTIVMADDIPTGPDMELFQQWDIVLNVPGQETWQALPQFPDDTWNHGSFVASLAYGPNPWSLSFYSFSDGQIVTNDLPGFVVVSGDTILMGVEANSFFDSGITGRLALDVKDAPFNPEMSRVVTAPPVPLTEGSFFDYLGGGATLVPGLPGLFDPVGVDPAVLRDDGRELLALRVSTAEPWGPMPTAPDEFFSFFVGVGIVPDGDPGQGLFFGFETHDKVPRTFGFGSDGSPITVSPAFIMDDGSLLFGTGLTQEDVIGSFFDVIVEGGFQETPDSEFQGNSREFTFDSDDVPWGDQSYLVEHFPVYDLTTGETVERPPEATTTTVAATPTTVAGGEAEDGDGFPTLLVVVLAVGALLGLLWWWFSTRRPDDIYRFGPTRERSRTPTGEGGLEEGGDDPRDTPPPVLYGEEVEEHPACGWGLYFHDGTREIPVREPAMHEMLCCKYVVRVVTDVRNHVQAARGRQDAGAERLRIPDFDYGWRWVDLVANTSARSGPAGRLDWMQGLGDPTEQAALASEEGYWQRAQGEEPPEVAAHLYHREVTDVDITLEAGCPEYVNLYSPSARSQLHVLATHECTNDAGDPCPVELNAFGFVGGWIVGPGNLWTGVADRTGTDPDELERTPRGEPSEREGAAPRSPWDGHDHVERDRATYEHAEKDNASDAFEQDDLSVQIENDVEIDAGQIVPVAVYPTTERVSAHIEADLKHHLDVQVNLTPENCEENNCGGHGRCNCHAEWKMQVSGAGGSWIDAGEGPFEILRDPTAADRRTPFTGRKSWIGKS